MRPGTDTLSTDRNSICRLFVSSEQLGISQSNIGTLINVSKQTFLHPFLFKSETSAHLQIAIASYCILITHFLTWQRYIQNPDKHLR